MIKPAIDLGHRYVITSHSVLWDIITYSCSKFLDVFKQFHSARSLYY